MSTRQSQRPGTRSPGAVQSSPTDPKALNGHSAEVRAEGPAANMGTTGPRHNVRRFSENRKESGRWIKFFYSFSPFWIFLAMHTQWECALSTLTYLREQPWRSALNAAVRLNALPEQITNLRISSETLDVCCGLQLDPLVTEENLRHLSKMLIRSF